MKRVIIYIWLCCWTAVVAAQSFESDGLWYEVTGKRTVQVVADPTDSVYRQFSTVTIPDQVQYEGRSYLVDRIDDQAFRYCHLLQDIQLPQGLKTIGFQAFMNCTQLREIHLPASLCSLDEMVFYGCASLESVYVGRRVKRWPDMCFSDCGSLKTIYHAARRAPKSHKMSFFNCPDDITYYHQR